MHYCKQIRPLNYFNKVDLLDKSVTHLRASGIKTVQRNCLDSIGERYVELRIQFVAQVRVYDGKSLPLKKEPDFSFEKDVLLLFSHIRTNDSKPTTLSQYLELPTVS